MKERPMTGVVATRGEAEWWYTTSNEEEEKD
jgi:hypothetical protein